MGGPAETLKVESWCIVLRLDAYRPIRKRDLETFVEISATLALGGRVAGSNKNIMVVQLDSPTRLEAVSRHLIKCGLRMTENGRFADFAIVHGRHGLAMPCDWIHFSRTEEAGEVSFRKECEYIDGLEDFAGDYHAPAWIDQVGHGFMLASEEDYDVWLDFATGRTLVSLKDTR